MSFKEKVSTLLITTLEISEEERFAKK